MNRIWFNGLIGTDSLAISAFDRGLTLGDGLFETLLVVNGSPLWLGQHVARFKTGARELGITFPEDTIQKSVAEICHRLNGLHALRLTLTRGAAGRGLGLDSGDFTYFATIQAFGSKMLFEPLTLHLASTRRNETSAASRIKTLSYMDEVLAAREAVAREYDDALMMNSKGNLASATIGNVFLAFGKTLVTPSLDQGILPGIIRHQLVAIAPQLGYTVEERSVDVLEIEKADGLFVTNSLRLLRPSKNHALKDFAAMIEALCAAASVQCGIDPRLA